MTIGNRMNQQVTKSPKGTHGVSPLLSMPDLAARYSVPLATVRKWRYDGYGPKGFPVGKYVRYRLSDCEAWENAQLNPDDAA